MAMFLLQGAQDVLQQQWESGGQGSQALRHLEQKKSRLCQCGRQTSDSGSTKGDGVARTAERRKENVKKSS